MKIIKHIGLVILAILLGSIANMLTLKIGGYIIPPPQGLDTSTPEGLAAAIPLFTPYHYIFPFLAHALGTFVGAYIAYRWTSSNAWFHANLIGVVFFLGGWKMIDMLPSPMWYNCLDLIAAYFPMVYLAIYSVKKLGVKKTVV